MNSKMTLSAWALLVTAGVLLVLYHYTNDIDIRAKVEPLQQVAGQPIRYVDSTNQATKWRWEFGNGQQSRQNGGAFYYYQPGTYLIRLTVNKEIAKTFSVVITPKPVVDGRDSVVQIQGPRSGYEQEKLVFKAIGGRARQFAWRFGESSQVDSRDQTAIYSYPEKENNAQAERSYTIELMTDLTKYPVKQRITIKRAFNRYVPTVTRRDNIGTDFQDRLQAIANGREVNENYNYLLAKYLCNRTNTTVRINEVKANDFFSYCMGLQFDRGVRIDAVGVVVDTVNYKPCVTRVNVTQH